MSLFSLKIEENGNLIKISNFPVKRFKRDLYRKYGTSRVLKFFYEKFGFLGITSSLILHKSFLPELIYLLNQFPRYDNEIEIIINNTWLKSTKIDFESRVKTSLLSELKLPLKPYQAEFLKIYDEKKQKYFLNGYILAFEQGLGKTITSLALMHCLEKDAIIVIAPKSTIRTVWKNEIDKIFKKKQDVFVIGDSIKKARFYIFNYEALDKLQMILKYLLMSKNVGIIVDESHNFRNVDAKRVIRLQSIAKITKANDILLMSGTPIKALGSEMLPALHLLDPFFDDFAAKIFKEAFGVNVPVALDILKNRLGLMMHRKMKSEVLNIPPKSYQEVYIKVSDGDKYTLDSVKKQVLDFIKEREKYYKGEREKYENDYKEVMKFLEMKLKGDEKFEEYKEVVEYLKRNGYDSRNKNLVQKVAKANKYEKEVLRPMLSSEMKKKFDRSKAVVKYLNLKIMGEVIGGLLNNLRAEMFSKMIKESPLCEIIKKSQKKTVCFTTYTDVLKEAEKYVRSQCKNEPILVFGETSSGILVHLKKFKEDTKANPLLATIQTLSTGVTLVEANTIVFLNQPWRYTDRNQAEDRVHRIGQDTPVFVYTFILDTGIKENLSTRMEDIVSWSKDMFSGIVGEEASADFNREVSRLLAN